MGLGGKMKYKIYFDVIKCNRFYSNFMRACDLGGITDVGVKGVLSYTTTTEPTKEYIEKMTKALESTKQEKSLGEYFANVKLNRIEIEEV
jgi:hypothetical protein